ncbi:hypothetical protein SNEBB_009818 [Seison nebaliae]|nr:hypothetical protein SNEBB_009818 [Seison nebaliae]
MSLTDVVEELEKMGEIITEKLEKIHLYDEKANKLTGNIREINKPDLLDAIELSNKKICLAKDIENLIQNANSYMQWESGNFKTENAADKEGCQLTADVEKKVNKYLNRFSNFREGVRQSREWNSCATPSPKIKTELSQHETNHRNTLYKSTDGHSSEDSLYCICKKVAYGPMIACDHPACIYEWFHYECVNIKSSPPGTWYCVACRKRMKEDPNYASQALHKRSSNDNSFDE